MNRSVNPSANDVNPYALLMSSAPAELCGPILTRLLPEIRGEVFADGTTPGLVAYAIAHGSAEERVGLAGNAAVPPDDLAVLADHTSEPGQAGQLFANPSAPREAMVRVMALAAGRLLPSAPGRLDGLRLDTARRASVAVESEDPEVVRSALRFVGGDSLPLGPTVVVRGCLGLLWTAGREAASQALREVRDLAGGELSAPVRDAFADPFAPASLGRALAYESSTPVLLEHLRRCRSRDEAVVRLHAPRDAIEWAFVLEDHRREPLPVFVRAALACQVGCPDLLRPPPTPTGALITAKVLRDGNPASAALGLLAKSAGGRDRDLDRAIAELTRPALGGNPEAWVVALNLLGDFVGTLPELVRTASAVAE